MEAVQYFADPDAALQYFIQFRWPHGVTCPHCGSKAASYLANQRRWQCHTKHPRRQFSAKVGTIFEESPLPLEKWLVAAWLETNAKNSISSYEVARALGITQKSAWFMLHRVRFALHVGSFDKKLSGVIEADETFIGGRAINMHKAKRAARIKGTGGAAMTPVMGLLERHDGKKHSTVRAMVLADRKKKTIHEVIHSNVEPGSSVYSDALQSYSGLSPTFAHDFIDHAEAYVKDKVVHTNGLENFWSLFKRCIKGTHVSIEPFHTGAYIDSEAFRFNNREVKDADRFAIALSGVSGKRLTYKNLIGMPTLGRSLDDSGEGSAEANC